MNRGRLAQFGRQALDPVARRRVSVGRWTAAVSPDTHQPSVACPRKPVAGPAPHRGSRRASTPSKVDATALQHTQAVAGPHVPSGPPPIRHPAGRPRPTHAHLPPQAERVPTLRIPRRHLLRGDQPATNAHGLYGLADCLVPTACRAEKALPDEPTTLTAPDSAPYARRSARPPPDPRFPHQRKTDIRFRSSTRLPARSVPPQQPVPAPFRSPLPLPRTPPASAHTSRLARPQSGNSTQRAPDNIARLP